MEREQVQKGRDLTPFCWVFRFGKSKVWAHKHQAYESHECGDCWYGNGHGSRWDHAGRVSSVQMSSADAAETEQWRVPLRQQVGPLYSLSEPGSLAATVSFSIPVAPSNCSASLHTLCEAAIEFLFLFETSSSYYSPGWFWTHDPSTSAPKYWELQACATMPSQ